MTDEDVKKIGKAFDEKFKKIGKDLSRIDSTLETIAEESEKQTKKLGILWEQVGEVTVALEVVKETLGIHTTFLKGMQNNDENNSDDIHKLNKRVVTLENTAGIVPPPELII